MATIRKDVARVVRLKEFHSRVEQLLTPADRDYFFYALKEYNTYKSVAKLMLALNSCLDTPEKLDLLPSIRELIPRHDRRKFDNLAPYNRMAHTLVSVTSPPQPTGGSEEGNQNSDTPPGVMLGAVKMVFLQRSKGESLGFSIRGGREHNIGIFISHVDPFSPAETSGLAAGDKIISVNNFSFDDITHQSAVLILRSHNQLQISVVSVGHVPGHPQERKSLIWIDTSGKPLDADKTADLSTSIEEDRSGGDRLLASPDKRKVVLVVEKQQALGFSVRGGKEFGLGIFISQVDAGSPAEQFGLKPGDQIVGVNGHSFVSILHHEAVNTLKTNTSLVMTVRSLGRLPLLVSEDEVDGPNDSLQPPASQPLRKQQSSHAHPNTNHAHIYTDHTHSNTEHAHKAGSHAQSPASRQKRWSNWKKSVSRRSQSLRDFLRPHSLYSHHQPHRPPRSHSHRHQYPPPRHNHQYLTPHSRLRTGSDGALTHRAKPHGRRTHSPVTNSNQKTNLSGTSSTPHSVPQKDQTKPPSEGTELRSGHMGEGRGEGELFFRYGVGTQLMLATTSSSAKALLEDSARRCLDGEEMAALTDRLREYESNGGVEPFAEFLVSLLDTPTKMQLLSDIRSVLNPTDLVTFDEIVSPHEIAALQKRTSHGTTPVPTVTPTAATPATTITSPSVNVTAATTATGTSPVTSTMTTPITLRPGPTDDLTVSPQEVGRDDRLSPSKSRRRVNVSVTFDQETVNPLTEGGQEVDQVTVSTRVGDTKREEVTEREDGEEREIRVKPADKGESRTPTVHQQPLSREESGGEEVGEEDGDKEEDEREASADEEEEVGYEEDVVEDEGGEGEKKQLESAATNYDLVLYEIKNHQGQESLQRAVVKEGGMGTPHIGPFGTEPAGNLLSRATDEESSMLGMQTRESFLEWNDDCAIDGQERDHTPSKNPVIIEIVKSAPQLGLTITGGVDTPSPGVIITDVKEGGAASIDGFLQPGFEIVQVDGTRIRGLAHDVAARELAAAFRSERPTIELIVIPV